MNANRLAAIQHAIQYPSGHLDRWANFDPAFEMSGPSGRPDDRPVVQPTAETRNIPNESADSEQTDGRSFTAEQAKQFILGGKAIFTIEGKQARYTFRITRSEPDQSGRSVYFVSLLTGPENLSDYTYIGLLAELTGQIRLTAKSRMTAESGPVRALGWVTRRIWTGLEIAPAKIWHIGACGRCGRALTVPASIESGFGPECLAKMNGGE
jgi:hypothetical protein